MKRLIWILVVSLLVLGMTPVFAAVTVDKNAVAKAQAIVDKANAEIDRQINIAVVAANYTDPQGDHQIADALVASTNAIAAKAIADAAKLGVTVECSLIKVKVGNAVVWVDPLFVCDD